MSPIGHLWVNLSLHFKARLSPKSLLWKSVFIHIEIRTNYHDKKFALRLALKERLRDSEMAYWRTTVVSRTYKKASSKNFRSWNIIEWKGDRTFRKRVVFGYVLFASVESHYQTKHLYLISSWMRVSSVIVAKKYLCRGKNIILCWGSQWS